MTILGLDFSHYDSVPEGARVVNEGFKFMTHKAGGDANDAELAAWWRALKPYRDRVLLGAYWVLYPGNPAGRADAFLARLNSQCSGWRDGPFILQVDCEKWNNDVSTVPSRGDIKAFCDRLAAKANGLRPIVYAPKWVYGESLAGLGYPLWASAYVNGSGTAARLYPGDLSSKWDSYSGQVPAILQYTSSATALGQTTCDANAFRGTLQELTALVAPGWETAMATLDTDDKKWMLDNLGPKTVWAYNLTDPYDTADPQRQVSAGSWLRYGGSRNLIDPRLPAAAGLAQMVRDTVVPALAEIQTALTALTLPGGLTAEQLTAIVADGVSEAFAEAFPPPAG